MSRITTLEKQLGYAFRDQAHLVQALTHRSKSANNNERLEFLGDALLETIISSALFHAKPNESEGDLTRLRATMVRTQTLAAIASDLNLSEYLIMGTGELRTGGFQRESIIADAFEAIIAAVYLDSDFETCRDVVMRIYAPKIAALPSAEALKDPKTRLQEHLQAKNLAPPEYRLIEETGPDHDKQFTVECHVGETIAVAKGQSKKKAEQAAAEKLISLLIEKTP